MATHSVERHLGLKIEDYDREIRRLVPHYDELVAEGIELARALVSPEARILDLGCGTGRLGAALLAAMPRVKVVLLDVDPAVLGQAKLRLAHAEARTELVHASFYDPLPRCDAVMACLALHHVMDLEQKTKIYRSIFDALPEGAPFLNLDASVARDPELSRLTFARWASAMKAHGIEEDEARKHFASWATEEHYFSLEEELAALARAGFTRPECFWRKGPLAIYGGRRA